MRPVRPIASAACVAILGATAPAQTTLFLQPSAFRAEVGREIGMGLTGVQTASNDAPAPLAWPGEVPWLFIRSGGSQDNRDRVETVGDGPESRVVLAMPAPGCAMVGVDFKPEIITMSGRQFASLLEARTSLMPDAALREREQVRVRHVRSAKALIRVDDAGTPPGPIDASTAVSKSGQAVEIRPFADPTLTPAPGDIPARMYVGGDAAAAPRLRLVHTSSGEAAELTAGGTATLALSAAGPWRVEFHHAAPLTGDPEADWTLYTATLVFEAPGAQEAGR